MSDLYLYRFTLTGRIRADSQAEAEDKLKQGISLNFHVGDSIDSMKIDTQPDPESFSEMKRKFPG